MTKKGFTLMELLVSIFISGMVMLALVAMWKTSSNHTAQAQRQSFIKNENTIFLRRFHTDFVSASEVICPWSVAGDGAPANPCTANVFVAIKEAVLAPDDPTAIIRLTRPVCGNDGNRWGVGTTNITSEMEERCVKPSYVVYNFRNNGIYRCSGNFLDSLNMDENKEMLSSFMTSVSSACPTSSNDNWELILPYVSSFSLTAPEETPELLLNYTVSRTFANADIPPVLFKMRRYFIRKKGI